MSIYRGTFSRKKKNKKIKCCTTKCFHAHAQKFNFHSVILSLKKIVRFALD